MTRMTEIQAMKYGTINDCLAAFFDCEVSGLKDLEGDFEMMWANGDEEKWEVQKAISAIRKRRCWGWLEDKTTLHFYARKNATTLQLVKMFAHEIGHMQRPYHRDLKEEQKADKYANVAAAAYEVARQATGK